MKEKEGDGCFFPSTFVGLMLGYLFAKSVPTTVGLITCGVLTLILIVFIIFCLYWGWKHDRGE